MQISQYRPSIVGDLQQRLSIETATLHSGTCQSYETYKTASIKALTLNMLREIHPLHDHQTGLYAEHNQKERLKICVGSARAF